MGAALVSTDSHPCGGFVGTRNRAVGHETGQWGPALLIQCKNQIEFGQQLVENWLNNFMFNGKDGADAKRIAEYLSDHGNFKTHSKHINIDAAKKLGLKITDIESSQDFQEHVLSAFHATMITLNAAVKLICNQNGNAFVKQMPVPIQMIQQKPSLNSTTFFYSNQNQTIRGSENVLLCVPLL